MAADGGLASREAGLRLSGAAGRRRLGAAPRR
uniref:Uncharacterized protein n=1 Tax=Arundo donax TaxID=35708 RepID=A0A0A8ZW83_ARUDO